MYRYYTVLILKLIKFPPLNDTCNVIVDEFSLMIKLFRFCNYFSDYRYVLTQSKEDVVLINRESTALSVNLVQCCAATIAAIYSAGSDSKYGFYCNTRNNYGARRDIGTALCCG